MTAMVASGCAVDSAFAASKAPHLMRSAQDISIAKTAQERDGNSKQAKQPVLSRQQSRELELCKVPCQGSRSSCSMKKEVRGNTILDLLGLVSTRLPMHVCPL